MGKSRKLRSRGEKSGRLIRHTDDNNSVRRRRDESNWRKEGPDAAPREKRTEKEKIRNGEWVERR